MDLLQFAVRGKKGLLYDRNPQGKRKSLTVTPNVESKGNIHLGSQLQVNSCKILVSQTHMCPLNMHVMNVSEYGRPVPRSLRYAFSYVLD